MPENASAVLMTPPEYYVWGVLAFVLGLCIGSFLNVVIYRLPLGMSVNNPKRSFCFRCGTQLRWYDNVPVLSYLLLRGRCRSCGASFSPRYAYVELLTGIIFAAIWFTQNPSAPDGFTILTLWYFFFASCLIVGTFTDFDHWIIPASVPRTGAVVAVAAAVVAVFLDRDGIIAQAGPFPALRVENNMFDRILGVMMGPSYFDWREPAVMWWEPIANSLIGAIFAPLMIYAVGVIGKILFRKEAMGFGDVELFVMIGAALGAANSVLVLVLASLFGSVAGITMMFINRMSTDKSPLQAGAVDLAQLEKKEERTKEAGPLDSEEAEQLRAFAESLEMECVDLSTTALNPEAHALLSADTAQRLRAIPLSVGTNSVRVAVEDPMKTKLVQELREILRQDIEFVIASGKQIDALCARVYKQEARSNRQPANPLWKRYYKIAGVLPIQGGGHHLPFIPWITLAALCVLLFQGLVKAFLNRLFLPTYF